MSFRDALSPELAKETFDHWRALRIGGKVPKKDDLCPLGLPPAALPHLMLMERFAPDEFRCRLIGTIIRDWYGENVVGQTMREMIPASAYAQRLPLLRHCIDAGAPAWFIAPLIIRGNPLRRGARLLLPVAFHGEDPDGVLLVAFISDDPSGAKPLNASISIDLSLVCPKGELG